MWCWIWCCYGEAFYSGSGDLATCRHKMAVWSVHSPHSFLMAFEEGACFPSASPFWHWAKRTDADSEEAPHNKGFHLQYLFFDRTLWAFIQFFPLAGNRWNKCQALYRFMQHRTSWKELSKLKRFSHAVTSNKAFLKAWPLLEHCHFINRVLF